MDFTEEEIENIEDIVSNCYDNRILIRECVEYYFKTHKKELKEMFQE